MWASIKNSSQYFQGRLKLCFSDIQNIQTAFVKPTGPTTCYNPIFIFSNVFKRKTE